jgi:3-phenylpropionate/trans-cinnamate dioxygenase ferredoxin reductase component
MSERQTFLIVGASLAGGRAAEALRQQGFDGRIVLVGAEPDRPYERPPLSKGVIRAAAVTDGAYLQTAGYYAEQDIELRLGVRATALDPAAKAVTFDGGATERYDKLLVATGSELRRLSVPGADLPGVRYLRTLADARALAGEFATVSRVAVVGAGFIGLEVAASARTLGREVTVFDPAAVPLVRALGPEMGALVAEVHRDHDVAFRSETGVAGFRGGDRVAEIITTAGDTVPCDVVVVGVGVTPAVGWLAGSGIAIENGVVVDEFTRTSLPDVFAAGDIANAWNPLLGERVRLEHYDNAQNQGIAAAGAMLGSKTVCVMPNRSRTSMKMIWP